MNPLNLIQQFPEDEVKEAYGSRGRLEENISTATSGDEDDAWMGVAELHTGSCHQKHLFPIAVRIPELLLLLLDSQHTVVRYQVLDSLAEHAQAHCRHLGWPGLLPDNLFFGSKVPIPLPERQITDYDRLAESTYKAVAQYAERYAGLLDSEDTTMIGMTLYVLSFLEMWPPNTQERVVALATSAESKDTRACAWMSLGLNTWRRREHLDLLVRARSMALDSDLQVRNIQSIGAAYCRAPSDNNALFEDLASGLREARVDPGSFPWYLGATAGLSADALTTLPLAFRGQIIDELLDSFEHQLEHSGESCEDPDWEWSVPDLIGEHLVRFAFAEFRGRKHEVLWTELNSAQRRIVEMFHNHRNYPPGLSNCGVRQVSKRYMGLDSPGPLDWKLSWSIDSKKQNWPIWKWWWMALRKAVSEDDLVERIVNEFTPREVAELAIDASKGDYDLYRQTPNDPVPFAFRLMDAVADQVEPLLRERADQLLAADVSISELSVVVLPLLRFWHETGHPIDWTYAPLIRKLSKRSRCSFDWVAAYVPKEDRKRLT